MKKASFQKIARFAHSSLKIVLLGIACQFGAEVKGLAVDTVYAWSYNYATAAYEQFPANGVVWITADPLMPYLAVQDIVTGVSPQPFTTIWQFKSQYTKTASRSIDSRAFPSSGFIGFPYGQFWYPSQQYFGSQFFGGTASFNFSDNVTTSIRSFPFKIRGRNPSPAVARQYINAAGAPYYARAIFQHESRSGSYIFNQFYPTGTSLGEPVFGAPDGWGIAQLDYTASGTTASTMQVWNWKANLSGGIAILAQKKQYATAYFTYIKSKYPTQWEAPPATYSVPGTSVVFTYLDAATITLYNGASVSLPGGYLSCWSFTPTNPPGKKWTFVPNKNNYVYLIAVEVQNGA